MPIAIIPARGGSQRIKRKNIRDFHGKPIMAYSIQAALDTRLFGRVVVSTDDAEIAVIAESLGAEVYWRPRDWARNEVGTQEVARECIEAIRYQGKYTCLLYATAPLITPFDLIDAFTWLTDNDNLDYIFSVGYPPLIDAGAFYWGTTEAFASSSPLVGPYTRLYRLPEERVCDINTFDDFHKAEEMYSDLEKMK